MIRGNIPKIWVLMSTYNGMTYIEEQIESILSQKNCDVHLLVRDDGSTDATLDILKSYEKKGSLTLISDNINLGPAKSFLKLLEMAPDDGYYAFSDQDDYWNSDKLERALEMLTQAEENNMPLVYYSNSDVVDQNLNSTGKKVYSGKQNPTLERVLCGYGIQGCTMVLNKALRDIFLSVDMSKERIGMHDFFLCDLCMVCGGKILYDDFATMKYRQHESNVVGYDVNATRLNKIKKYINEILKPANDSIADDARLVLMFSDKMTEKGRNTAIKIERYKDNAFTRIWLACSILMCGFEKKELLKAVRILLKNV